MREHCADDFGNEAAMSHTPGPWHVVNDEAGTPTDIRGPQGQLLADTFGELGEAYANARLIAASPALLAACRAAREMMNWEVETASNPTDWDDRKEALVVMLDAAIRQAEAR